MNASSCGVLARPSSALRCGKRPNRRMMSWWCSANRCASSPSAAVFATHSVVVSRILRMHQRQVHEVAQVLGHLEVQPALQRRAGDAAGHARRSHTCAPCRETHCAETGPAGSAAPARPRRWPPSRPARRRPRARASARKRSRNSGVEGRVLLEPALRPGGAPERDDLGRFGRLGCSWRERRTKAFMACIFPRPRDAWGDVAQAGPVCNRVTTRRRGRPGARAAKL